MESLDHHKFRFLVEFSNPKSMRRAVLVLLSLSLLFSYLSWLPTPLFSLDALGSSSLSDFLLCYINKKVIFLLCNGIVFFVSGCSGFIGSYNLHEDAGAQMQLVESKVPGEEQVPVRGDTGGRQQLREEEEKEEEEEEGDASVNSGESDARFEDFIRRMKEGMRTEARQLVLMV